MASVTMVDYSKWDNLDSGSEDDEPKLAPKPSGSAYTAEERAAAEAAAQAAAAANWKPEADPRAEINRLKAEKRAARQAREAAAGGAPASEDATPDTSAEPQAAEEPVAPSGPLEMLDKSEAAEAAIRTEVAALEAAAATVKDQEEVGKLVQRVTALSGAVGKLQGEVDMIMIGELDDTTRDGAKARRKKLNSALEADLMPMVAACRKKVLAAKNAL